jgi:hypothetical protein
MTSPESEYRTITLTRGQVAIVDSFDYDWLNQWKWFAHYEKKTESFYACRSVVENKKRGTIWMHRQILGLSALDGKIGDHKNSEKTLDNRRENLRVSTQAQSLMNRRKCKRNRCGAKGVSLNNGTYLVRIGIGGKTIYIGRRKTINEAELLYAEASKKYHGDFGRT